MNHMPCARSAGVLIWLTFLFAGGCMSGTTQSFRPDPAVACTIQEFPIVIELDPRVTSEGYQAIPPVASIMLQAIDNRGISAMRGPGATGGMPPGLASIASTSGHQLRPLTPIEVESGPHVLQFAILGSVWEPGRDPSASGASYPARPLPIHAIFSVEVELNTGENYLVEGRMAGRWVSNGFIVTITEERTGRVLVPPMAVGLRIPLPDI